MSKVKNQSFAARLRAQRLSQNLSQRQLAKRSGVSTQGINYLERELRHPTLATAEKLAKSLGVDVMVLVKKIDKSI